MRGRIPWLVLLSLAIASGCTTRVADLTIASSKNLNRTFDVVGEDIVGVDCMHQYLLLFSTGSMNRSIETVIDTALAPIPEADAIVNARFEQETLFTLLYNRICLRVRGDAIRTRQSKTD